MRAFGHGIDQAMGQRDDFRAKGQNTARGEGPQHETAQAGVAGWFQF